MILQTPRSTTHAVLRSLSQSSICKKKRLQIYMVSTLIRIVLSWFADRLCGPRLCASILRSFRDLFTDCADLEDEKNSGVRFGRTFNLSCRNIYPFLSERKFLCSCSTRIATARLYLVAPSAWIMANLAQWGISPVVRISFLQCPLHCRATNPSGGARN